jgi:hypothetical protein
METLSNIPSKTMSDNNVATTTAVANPRYMHYLAQNLNNEACCWIAKGNYDAAISGLKRALELTQIGLSNERDGRTPPCGCKRCALESHLTLAEDNHNRNDEARTMTPEAPLQKPRSLKRKRSIIGSIETVMNSRGKANSLEETDGFVYRRPMRVHQECIDRCHYNGATLSFVSLFNIALAYHLKAIETVPSMVDSKEKLAVLQQPLKLYELAYQLHFQCQEGKESQTTLKESMESCDSSSSTCTKDPNLINLRLMMLVTSNISQIHKLAGNDTKHHQCLEHLLNAVMYMNHGCDSDNILTPREKDGIFDNLAPILKTKLYAAAA